MNDVKCREWVLDGECVINFVWMIVNCVSDCYMCKNNESLLDGGMKMMWGVVVIRLFVVIILFFIIFILSMYWFDLDIYFFIIM